MTLVILDPVVAYDDDAADSGPAPDGLVRFTASDLSEAQHRYARLAAEHKDTRILVDVDVHIAADARTARREVLESGTALRTGVLRYVGTSAGLAGLIADIVAVDVADGVVVRPVVESAADGVIAALSAEVVPALRVRRVRAS